MKRLVLKLIITFALSCCMPHIIAMQREETWEKRELGQLPSLNRNLTAFMRKNPVHETFFIKKILVSPDSHIAVVGDLHACSFDTIEEMLHNMDILDDQKHVTDKWIIIFL